MEVLRVEVSLQCACCFNHALHPMGPCTSPDTPPGRPVSKVPQEDRRRHAREPPIYVYQRHLCKKRYAGKQLRFLFQLFSPPCPVAHVFALLRPHPRVGRVHRLSPRAVGPLLRAGGRRPLGHRAGRLSAPALLPSSCPPPSVAGGVEAAGALAASLLAEGEEEAVGATLLAPGKKGIFMQFCCVLLLCCCCCCCCRCCC